MSTQTNNRQLTKNLNGDKSDSSNGSKNTLTKSPQVINDDNESFESFEGLSNQESDDSSIKQRSFRKNCNNKNRRNSIDSNNSNSTNTKARLKWWSDRRRHRSSVQSVGNQKNSSDLQNFYSVFEGNSVKRIKKKKLKNAVWTEELWVDGPKAVQPLNSANLEKSSEKSGISSEANELHKKQLRIEQWIQNTFCTKNLKNNNSYPPSSTDDQVSFYLKDVKTFFD